MLLMHADIQVLFFDTRDTTVCMLNERHLPFALRDLGHEVNILDIKEYLSSRLLNPNQENAKAILDVAALPQTLKLEQRLKIALACRGLCLYDSYWLKEDNEDLKFKDVNLRLKSLSDSVLDVALMGRHLTIHRDLLVPELTTTGMFKKCWQRLNGETVLFKSDSHSEFVNTYAELEVSRILDSSNVSHVRYSSKKLDNGVLVAYCSNMANDEVSFVPAADVHDATKFAIEKFPQDFANMCVVDYVIGNTDRHEENWGFLYNTANCDIISMSPLFDHNQALICDQFGTNLDELIYEPTDMQMLKSVRMFGRCNNCCFRALDGKLAERYAKVLELFN